MRPLMSDAELTLFNCALQGKRHILEFGIGGSTYRLAASAAESVFSVESDVEWIRKLAEDEALQPHLASGKLRIHHADIGSTRFGGHPAQKPETDRYANYWLSPWRLVQPDKVDLLFVDGRFRVACALSALLNGSPNLTVGIHDFWNRPEYGMLLKYFNCACRAEKLGIFFPNSDIDRGAVIQDLWRYAVDSR